MNDEGYSRRTVLGVGGAGVLGVGLLGLAGCSASKSSSDAPAPASSAGAGGSSTAGGSPAGALVKLSDVPVGGSVAATAKFDGKPVVVSQKTAGAVTAFSAICTHMGCTVNAGGAQFHCPCHGSIYDAFTGQVIQGPAPTALTSIPVTVSGDEVVAS
ncbi:QcrA and Rieske domain-containing protein [Jatrophihabitans sp. DSM 45814]